MARNQGGGAIMSSAKKVCLRRAVYSIHGADSFPLALDQIITQLMENSQAHPVPATEEIMEKLPREVLEEGCKS